MFTILIANLRHSARRYLAPGLAVLLGVAFVASSLVLGSTTNRSLLAAIAGDTQDYAVIVTPDNSDELLPATAVATLRAHTGVQEVTPVRSDAVLVPHQGAQRYLVLSTPPGPNSKATMTEGRMATASGELTISSVVADLLNAKVGQTIRVDSLQNASLHHEVRIVGIMNADKDPMYNGGTPATFASAATVAELTGRQGFSQLRVRSEQDPGTLAAQLRTALPNTKVETGEQFAANQFTEITGGTDFLTSILLAFGGIAMFVAAMVIGNTFSVLLARRTRETALLRCVGATRRQVVLTTVLEAVTLGVIASVLGLITGTGLAYGAARLSTAADLPIPLDAFSVTPRDLVVPLLIGVLMTVLATLSSVLRASRVAPVAALRPVAPLNVRTWKGLLLTGLGIAMIAFGGLLLTIGAGTGGAGGVLTGMAGGAVSFLGVLLAGTVLIPAVAQAVGVLPARLLGIPGQVGLESAVRNPGRAASTTSALLIGVTLISTLMMGAATTQRAVDRQLLNEFPLDGVVTATAPISAPAQDRLAHLDRLDAAVALPQVTLTLAGTELDVLGVPAAAQQVSRSALGSLRERGVLTLNPETLTTTGLDAGQAVQLNGHRFTIARGQMDSLAAATSAEDLAMIGTPSTVRTMWLRFDDGVDARTAMSTTQQAVQGVDGAQVTGGIELRAQLTNVVNVMVAVATGLLGIAVLIAVVGIANTLSLSVLERRQEHGLLRALGLTRGQLRAAIAFEAVLIAVVATALGLVLGGVYAYAGALSLLHGHGATPSLVLPWGQLLTVAVAALVAGLLAAVMPARRAANAAPAAALAAE